MKRVRSYELGDRSFLFFVLSVLMLLPAGAQTIGDAFYVYRNDGQFNAFFRDEVLSMEYSYEDADGITYDDVVTQVIETADSTYRIPIAAIDSISFVQPKTEYKSEVVHMSKMLPYIESVDGLIVTFSSSIPSNLFPKKGDILLQDNYESDKLPEGFAGKVVKITGQQVLCESVSFEDIYDRIVCYGSYTAIDDAASGKVRLAPRKVSGVVSSAVNISGNVGASESGLYLNVDGSLGFDLRATFKYEARKSPYVDFSIAPKLKIGIETGAKGEMSGNTLAKLEKLIAIPIPDTPFLLQLKSGPVLKPSLKASIKVSTEATLGYKFGVKYVNGSFRGYGKNTSKSFSMPDVEGYISGNIFAGIQTEFGITTYGDLLSVSLVKEVGAEFEANITEKLLKSDKYEELQDAQFDLNLAASLAVNARAQFFKFAKAEASFDILSGKVKINSWKLVPTFGEPVVTVNETTAVVSVSPSENLLFSVGIGVGIWNENGGWVGSQFYSGKYRKGTDWPRDEYKADFSGLTEGQTYFARPLVSLFGANIIAFPEKPFKIDGQDDSDNPDDPDNPDNPHSGGQSYLSCPDDNHPHAIDLGLPSGTKWACCNVGTSSPEQYGSYFAWGETNEKNVYNDVTYKYSSGVDSDGDGWYNGGNISYQNIGADIAGTSNDVAHVKWGGSWVIPSINQMQELLSDCSYVWTTENGVFGGRFTGANGGSVFLPAAGLRRGGDLGSAGSYGYYWSSSFYGIYKEYAACRLFFNSDCASWEEYFATGRILGLSVRPVRKN